jgi:hypothetical protein
VCQEFTPWKKSITDGTWRGELNLNDYLIESMQVGNRKGFDMDTDAIYRMSGTEYTYDELVDALNAGGR